MEAEKATGADLVADDVTVVCPEPQRGKQLVVIVRAIDVGALAAVLGGIPPLVHVDPNETPEAKAKREAEEKKRADADQVATLREVARLGIVSPAMTFGDASEPGKAWWGMVKPANRTAIFSAIAEATGLTADGGPLGRFPGESEGGGAGVGAGRTVEASAVVEPAFTATT